MQKALLRTGPASVVFTDRGTGVLDVLGRTYPLEKAEGPADADADVEFRFGRADASSLPRFFPRYSHNGLRGLGAKGRRFLSGDGLLAAWEPGSGRASVEVRRGRLAPSLLADEFLPLLLFDLLRRRGLYHLHGAALVRPKGGGLLVVGEAGAGKSALSLSLARSGYSPVGDDAVFLWEEAGKIEAAALPRPPRFSRKTLRSLMPETMPETVGNGPGGGEREDGKEASGRGKRRLSWQEVSGGEAVRSGGDVDLVIFIELTGAPGSELFPIPPSEALARLVRAAPFVAVDPEEGPGHLAVLSGLCRQARTLRLLAGSDGLRPGFYATLIDDPGGPRRALAGGG